VSTNFGKICLSFRRTILHLTQFREIPEDEHLRRRWNALVQRAQCPQVFFSWEWALAVQRAYQHSLRPWVLLLEDDDESLVGLAALATDASQERVCFLGSTTADYCDFLSVPGYGDAIVEAVLSECKKLNAAITLANLPADSATSAALGRAASNYGYHLHQRSAYLCTQVSTSSQGQRGEVKAALGRKKMRRLIGTMDQKFAPRLEHLRSWDDVEGALPSFEQAHVARFLATGRISNLAFPDRRKFLEELAALLSEAGWLTLTQLRVGDRSVGWNYGFQFARSWFWYQPTFDTDLEQFSPGAYLLAKIVSEACESENVELVDLGLGAEGYKERFANSSRETLHLTLVPSFLEHLRGLVRYRAVTFLKKWPAGERRVRSVLASMARSRERFGELGLGKSLEWTAKRAISSLIAEDRVYFYDWSTGLVADQFCGLSLRPVDLNVLAAAAMEYWDDQGTLNYLLSCAKLLRGGSCDGFALVDSSDRPVHFLWTAPFEGFRLKGFCDLTAPEPDLVLLFDCWTPYSLRRRDYHMQALHLVAKKTVAEGKRIWTYDSTDNPALIRPPVRTGFRLSYSLKRRRVLWWKKIDLNLAAPGEAGPRH
jgi:CelD/BcsL family acetyltransferase involved in cellulose biosynthesis